MRAGRVACAFVVAFTVASALAALAGCAATVPKAELARCTLGIADGNESLALAQGPACRSVANRLAADDQRDEAVGYARRACQLEDARGCEVYLALVRALPSPGEGEVQNARAAGEKACAGIVVSADGVDARPSVCAKTADLYLAVEPKGAREAGRLYARACSLGDPVSCAHAEQLGVAAPAPTPVPAPAPALVHLPAPMPMPAHSTAPARASVCHDLRACVALDVRERNTTEIVGMLTNHCDRPVFCSFCPARGGTADRGACHTISIAAGESKSGKPDGLWYDGYTGIAYDCSDAADDRSCTP
jgi:hypothetical protein